MKKLVFAFLVCITILLVIDIVSTLDAENAAESLKEKKELTEEKIQEIKEAYLAKEWTKFIRNSPTLSQIYSLNPLFKFLIGYEFSISWAFTTAIIIWFIFFFFFYPQMQLFFKNFIFATIASVATASISAHYAIPKTIDALSSLIKNIWHNLISIIILIFILIVLNRVSGEISKKIKQYREKRKVAKLEKETALSKATREEFERIKEKGEAMERGKGN